MKKSIGYNIDEMPQKPQEEDKKSPFHSNVSIRGKTFVGTVVSDLMNKTVKVEWENTVRDKKYNRYMKSRTKVAAHNPIALSAKVGDKVLIAETRPLSKTKHFAVIKILSQQEEE